MKKLAVVLLGACLSLTACASWIEVKPSEIPKLNGMTMGVVDSGPDQGRAIAVSVRRIEKKDGTLTEITGKADVRVTTGDTIYLFRHPIQAEVRGGALIIQSANLPRTTIPLDDIEKAEISQ